MSTTEVAVDPMLEQAKAIVRAEQKVSISFIQRQLAIGYNRAARLVEELEAGGYIGPDKGDGAKRVIHLLKLDADAPEAADPSTLVVEDPDAGAAVDAEPVTETESHARAFMLGKMMESARKRFTTLAVPYSQLNEREQTNLLRELSFDMKDVIRAAVKIIAANARVTFRAEVESVQFKGPTDVKATLKLVNSEHTHSLADSAGGFVTIVIEDLDELLSVPEDALKGEPDNRPLFDASTEG
ncbi:MAG: toprim domain protein [Phage 67_12]|nr:MAG: toprim domain protein [Phage 67_12]